VGVFQYSTVLYSVVQGLGVIVVVKHCGQGLTQLKQPETHPDVLKSVKHLVLGCLRWLCLSCWFAVGLLLCGRAQNIVQHQGLIRCVEYLYLYLYPSCHISMNTLLQSNCRMGCGH
jgi:hypothetical protein